MSNIKKIKPASPKPTSQNTYPAGPIALVALLTKAQERRLVANDDPAALAACYFALLWGDLLLSLLMRVREAPTEREIQTRARAATETLMARR
jgi:hypothetical protein